MSITYKDGYIGLIKIPLSLSSLPVISNDVQINVIEVLEELSVKNKKDGNYSNAYVFINNLKLLSGAVAGVVVYVSTYRRNNPREGFINEKAGSPVTYIDPFGIEQRLPYSSQILTVPVTWKWTDWESIGVFSFIYDNKENIKDGSILIKNLLSGIQPAYNDLDDYDRPPDRPGDSKPIMYRFKIGFVNTDNIVGNLEKPNNDIIGTLQYNYNFDGDDYTLNFISDESDVFQLQKYNGRKVKLFKASANGDVQDEIFILNELILTRVIDGQTVQIYKGGVKDYISSQKFAATSNVNF